MTGSRAKAALTGKSLLVVGCAGFIGKMLLCRLLAECPSLKSVYVLLRKGKYASVQHRFENDVAVSDLFSDSVDKKDIFFFKKIHVIEGDISVPNCGIDDDLLPIIKNDIDFIINTAGNVNFDERLDVALNANSLSCSNILNLSRQFNCNMLHVSTVYVNGDSTKIVHEVAYSNALKSKFNDVTSVDVIKDCESYIKKCGKSRSKLKMAGVKVAQKYGFNDVYLFTKWLGELILCSDRKDTVTSVTIIRPSIVESAYVGPIKGWIDGCKVADSVLLAYAKGKTRFFPGNSNNKIDVIPVDLVCNSIILATCNTINKVGEYKIYQCASTMTNPITLKQFSRYLSEPADEKHAKYDNLFHKKQLGSFVFLPKYIFWLMLFSASLIRRMGKSNKGRSRTTISLAKIYAYYTQLNVVYSNKNLIELFNSFPPDDQRLFPVNASIIDWQTYLGCYHLAGVDKYICLQKNAKA